MSSTEEAEESAASAAGKDECRICRCSADELKRTKDRLHRLKCACAGSVRHLCGGCFATYYLAQGLDSCELCRQPIGIDSDRRKVPRRRNWRRQPSASSSCSVKCRFLGYACFILLVFVVVFVVLFAISAGQRMHLRLLERQRKQHKLELENPPGIAVNGSATTTSPSTERSIESLVVATVACVNLAIAMAYIACTYRRLCDRRVPAEDEEVVDGASRSSERMPMRNPEIEEV